MYSDDEQPNISGGHDREAAVSSSSRNDSRSNSAKSATVSTVVTAVPNVRIKRTLDRRLARRRRFVMACVVGCTVAFIGLAVFGAFLVFGTTKDTIDSSTTTEAKSLLQQIADELAPKEEAEPQVDPTPLIAHIDKMQIRLPVSVKDLTEVGFHPPSFYFAQAMEVDIPLANQDDTDKGRGTKRKKSKQKSGEGAKLTGKAIQMVRRRPTFPTGSIDVGAPKGSTTYAPVNGVVEAIRIYSYEGRVDDYEIHVRCDDNPNLEMVMVHIDDVKVRVGDKVIAGVTKMAKIRNMAAVATMQLAAFTGEAGNHTHIQFNDTTDARYADRQKRQKKSGKFPVDAVFTD